MKLLNMQKKFINSKPCEYSILKGNSNTGKSEAILHRALNLVSNFAYEEEDKILFVHKESSVKEKLATRYNEINAKNKYAYMSLLTSDIEPEFSSLSEIVEKYIGKTTLASSKDKMDILKDILFNNRFSKCKKLTESNIFLILNEIKYIKNNSINSEEEYMTLMGAPLKLRKNSLSRVDMYRLFTLYNEKLSRLSLVDEEDRINLAMNFFKEDSSLGYVHIIIDNVEQLSKLELSFLLSLYKKKSYGTITLGIDIDKGENIYSELVKKGRVYAKKVFGSNKKVFNFKVNVLEDKKNIFENMSNLNIRDNYKFIDLKHRRSFGFAIEHTGYEERILGEHEEKYLENELEAIPVFNNIAAGEPILITPEQEDTFTLPKYWVKGGNKKFILKVKGNSMINANINDGDFVVIEQNNAPVNGDIVAVNIEGNATLKTLKIGKNSVTLMPENEAYEPITVSKDEEFYVLGKAIGVIRK